MIRVAIGGKSKILLNHLTKTPPEQLPTEKYEAWEKEDLIVFSWLIQNIEPNISSNLTEYPTAKALWDALVVTYSIGKGVWGEIDRIDPNRMKCKEDIQTYTKIKSKQKLFQFLNGLDRKFEPIKREILRVDPLPTAEAAYATVRKEAAYATVRKEAAHQIFLGVTNNETHGIATGLIAEETDGMDLSTKGFRRFDGKKKLATRDDKSHLKSSNKGAKKDKPSTSPTANTRKSTKNSNDRRSEGGFEGVAATVGEEGLRASRISGWDRLLGVALEDGLYYVDEVVQSSTVMLAHGTTKREAWLWHRRLDTLP
nr:hypothetical protein [Tanacetum cinerariifolium]